MSPIPEQENPDRKGPEIDTERFPVGENASAKSHVATSDEDVAAAYAERFNGADAYSPKEEMWLRWKIDFRLIPILWFNITLG